MRPGLSLARHAELGHYPITQLPNYPITQLPNYQIPYPLLHDLALVGHERPARDLVVEIDAYVAVLHEMLQEGGDVLGVHLARVIRDRRRQVRRPENRHAVRVDDLVRPGELAVAAALRGQIDNHR